MNFDWRHGIILAKLTEGCTYGEAASVAGISRQAVWKRMAACLEFAAAVRQAREAGQIERRFRARLHHPFRGLRPPTGKGHGGNGRAIGERRGSYSG